jgi:O-antigen/teichoic acid export membrane protein
MRIQDHLSKLSWTLADKALYVGYGFVQMLQIHALAPEEFACYALVNGLYLFAVSLSDASVLQSVIMFGHDSAQRGAVNRFALGWHTVWILVWGVGCVLLQVPLAGVLHEPRLGGVMWYVPLLCMAALPRMLVLKMLYRDVQARTIFAVNAAWFLPMTLLTAWMLATRHLRSFREMLLIALAGLLCSSLVALWVGRKSLVFAVQKHVEPLALREFITYQSAISVASNAVKQLDIYLVQYFFGMVSVGVYQSAKTLFRFVDEAFSALIGLLYPGAVRLINERREDDLRALLSKALSFTLVAMLLLLVLTASGGASWLFTLLLPAKYYAASTYFTGLCCAAPCIAFSMLAVVIIAYGESNVLLRYMLLSGGAGLAALVAVGLAGEAMAAPIGFVVYHAVLGIFVFRFIQRTVGFPLPFIFRCFPDTWNFLASRLVKIKA